MNTFHVGSGAMTYWSMGQETEPQDLRDGLVGIGIDVTIPDGRSWPMALKAAMCKLFDKREESVKELKNKAKNGYVVVVEQKGEDDNTYYSKVQCKVDKETGMVSVPRGYYDESELQRLTNHYRRVLPSADVGQVLVKLLTEKYGGLAMKKNGGLYFIQAKHTVIWRDISRVVERSACDGTENKVTTVPFELNGDTMRDVRDAMNAEYEAQSQAILEELAAKPDMGDRAISNRVQHASDQIARLKEYESMLDDTLYDCRESLKKTLTALAHAQAARDAKDFADDILGV